MRLAVCQRQLSFWLSVDVNIFIARQHAIHAERDIIVLPSVCLSVQCRYCVKRNGNIITLFGHSGRSIILVLSSPNRRYKIPRGTSSVGALNISDR